MPRNVIPAVLMASSSPQSFSLGVCRLTTTMECGSMVCNFRLAHFLPTGWTMRSENVRRVTGRLERLLTGDGIAIMQQHEHKAGYHDESGEPTHSVGSAMLANVHRLTVGVYFSEGKSGNQP